MGFKICVKRVSSIRGDLEDTLYSCEISSFRASKRRETIKGHCVPTPTYLFPYETLWIQFNSRKSRRCGWGWGLGRDASSVLSLLPWKLLGIQSAHGWLPSCELQSADTCICYNICQNIGHLDCGICYKIVRRRADGPCCLTHDMCLVKWDAMLGTVLSWYYLILVTYMLCKVKLVYFVLPRPGMASM